eukprot:scaffold156237_cov21-Tisochrysis_lutea.AAC.1
MQAHSGRQAGRHRQTGRHTQARLHARAHAQKLSWLYPAKGRNVPRGSAGPCREWAMHWAHLQCIRSFGLSKYSAILWL